MLPISQRPLLATVADSALFVGRARELERLARTVRLGFNTLVLGDRGAGKTSLLRRFELQLLEADVECKFVDASGATTVSQLIDAVHTTLYGRHLWEPVFSKTVGVGVDLALGRRVSEALAGADSAVEHVRRLVPPDGERVVVLLDSINDPSLVQHLFGRLRDEVWLLPLSWVVAGHRPERSRYLEPPADSFFDTVIDVAEFDEGEAAELLRRRGLRVGHEDPAGRVLLSVAAKLAQQVAPRTPRNLLAAARELLIEGEDDPTRWVTNQRYLQTRAVELGRAPAMLFTEMMDLGPVSASDKRLLDRLGWTRPRAAQVFKQLEAAGLVVVTEEAPDGPGRPRRLYAANPAYHAFETLERDR